MKNCFNCGFKKVDLDGTSFDDMVMIQNKLYVKCLIGNAEKIVDQYMEHCEKCVGELDDQVMECHTPICL